VVHHFHHALERENGITGVGLTRGSRVRVNLGLALTLLRVRVRDDPSLGFTSG